MCGGDDHLAWKHPVSSETCRGGVVYRQRVQLFLLGIPLTHPFFFIEPPCPYRLSLGPIRILFLHVGASMGF